MTSTTDRKPFDGYAACTTDEAVDLYLFAVNDAGVVRSSIEPMTRSMCRYVASRIYEPERAVTAWFHVAATAAKEYHRQHGTPGDHWFRIFPPAVRLEVARELSDTFESEYDANQHDGINPVPADKRPATIAGASL